MRLLLRLLVALLITASVGYAGAHAAPVDFGATATVAIHGLLHGYASHDQRAVTDLFDPRGFSACGSDASEIVKAVPEVRKLMDADLRRWRTARFGAIRDCPMASNGKRATAHFQGRLSVGGQPSILARFSTTWRSASSAWRLGPSANTVPTGGESVPEAAKARGAGA